MTSAPADLTERITLSDLIYGFVGNALKHGKETLPASSRVWHEMLYEFTHAEEFGRFDLRKFDNFSWDGPYPKSEELSEVLQWLSVGGLCMLDITNGRLRAVLALKALFYERLKQLKRYNKELPEAMFAAACNYTGFFE